VERSDVYPRINMRDDIFCSSPLALDRTLNILFFGNTSTLDLARYNQRDYHGETGQ